MQATTSATAPFNAVELTEMGRAMASAFDALYRVFVDAARKLAEFARAYQEYMTNTKNFSAFPTFPVVKSPPAALAMRREAARYMKNSNDPAPVVGSFRFGARTILIRREDGEP